MWSEAAIAQRLLYYQCYLEQMGDVCTPAEASMLALDVEVANFLCADASHHVSNLEHLREKEQGS
eukprot:SAG11_NODE_2589_length_3188_cov_2.228155_3_plen_65_part_00